MEEIIKTYTIKIIRVAGYEPITNVFYEQIEENIDIDATSPDAAVHIAHMITTIQFRGQTMRVFVNGNEFFDERF